jgi:hypothetical protein
MKAFEAEVHKVGPHVNVIYCIIQVHLKTSHLSIKSQECPMELACDESLKIKFEDLPLHDFWIYIRKEYLELSQLDIGVLLPFGTTYLCEKVFSAMTAIKIKVP